MSRWILMVVAPLLAACTGEISIGDPQVEVTHLSLSTDSLGALQAQSCVMLHGQQACPTYPNPQACDELRVSIRGDGNTVGDCMAGGKPTRTLRGVGDGLPLACRMDHNTGCVQCEDLYGGAVVDTCGETELFSGQGFVSQDTGTLVPPDDVPQDDVPPGGSSSKCDVQQAQQAFIAKLNAILNAEGLKFSWSPDLAQLPKGSGFFSDAAFSFADEICSGDAPGVQDTTGCDDDAKVQGRCYCEEHKYLGVRCRCSRMTAKVLGEICATIPADCDQMSFAVAMWKIYGAASQWLTGGIPGLPGGATTVSGATAPSDITCLGSPLVLDLDDDGVALGPVDRGVQFDLLGYGAVRTAWITGDDDALLAMDRNGDGRITSGAELFGEGSNLGGRRAADGFAALAVLDRPDHGGNGNGLVESGDLMYDQLVLWVDANHDGVSQRAELRALDDVGVTALQVRGERSARLLDQHGNDLSLRARFLRQDGGSGQMVDALFVYGD